MIDKLKTLFNPDFICEYTGAVTIEEEDPQAKVRSVRLENGDFIYLNKKILDQMNLLFKQKDDRFSLCKGCDGVLIYHCAKEKYLILIELKSKYTYDNIIKAESQIEASYAKLFMLLHSFDDFVKENYKCCALIIALEPDIETLSKLTKKAQIMSGYCKERFCIKLYNAKDSGLILKHDISLLKNLPLKMDYKFDELPIFFIPYSEKSIDIRKYL